MLKELSDLYWPLLSRGLVAPEGYSPVKIHGVISLDKAGGIIEIRPVSKKDGTRYMSHPKR